MCFEYNKFVQLKMLTSEKKIAFDLHLVGPTDLPLSPPPKSSSGQLSLMESLEYFRGRLFLTLVVRQLGRVKSIYDALSWQQMKIMQGTGKPRLRS